MPLTIRLCAWALLVLGGLWPGPFTRAAQAQSCNFAFSGVNFGNVDVTTGASADAAGSFSASCTGRAGAVVRICPHLGPGSGGAGANGSPRSLIAGSGSLGYNLYQDNGRTVIWGSHLAGWAGAAPPQIDVTLNVLGIGSATATVYGRLAGGQNAAAVGNYLSTFSGADVKVRYAYAASDDCTTLGSSLEASPSFSVRAAVQARCTVSANTMDFGATGSLVAARDAANTVSVVCTRDAPYTVALGSLLGGLLGPNPTQRRMTRGLESILYGLYRDAARTQPWGDDQGVNTAAGIGVGATQNYTVYGRVPPQATPSPGTYTDTVVVTVTY